MVDGNNCMRQDSTSPQERCLSRPLDKDIWPPCFDRNQGQRQINCEEHNCSRLVARIGPPPFVHQHEDDSEILTSATIDGR